MASSDGKNLCMCRENGFSLGTVYDNPFLNEFNPNNSYISQNRTNAGKNSATDRPYEQYVEDIRDDIYDKSFFGTVPKNETVAEEIHRFPKNISSNINESSYILAINDKELSENPHNDGEKGCTSLNNDSIHFSPRHDRPKSFPTIDDEISLCCDCTANLSDKKAVTNYNKTSLQIIKESKNDIFSNQYFTGPNLLSNCESQSINPDCVWKYGPEKCKYPRKCSSDYFISNEESSLNDIDEPLIIHEQQAKIYSAGNNNNVDLRSEECEAFLPYRNNNNETKSSHSIHVQFDTTFYDSDSTEEKNNSLINCSNTEFKKLSMQRVESNSLEPTEYNSFSNFKKRLMKRMRQTSSSSTLSSDSSSSSSSDFKGAEFERRAPDGGWGWVVVFASFMIHCIADGVTMSFGVLYVEFLSFFKESRSLTSWVGSLFMAIPLLAGPLASLLTDRYGCRAVTICGSIIACVGFFLSAFANSIIFLLFTIGIVTGIGLAVCYVAAIVIVAFYFEKYRSLATGVAVAGSGIGTFIFAPLIQYLLDVFGWRGCMILLAGIFLNMAVCGSLMRDLEWTKKLPKENSLTETSSTSRHCLTTPENSNNSKHHIVESSTLPSINELKQIVQSGEIIPYTVDHMNIPQENRRCGSLVLLPTFLDSTTIPREFLKNSSRESIYDISSQFYSNFMTRCGPHNISRCEVLAKRFIGETPKLDAIMSTPHIRVQEPSEEVTENLKINETTVEQIETSELNGNDSNSLQVGNEENIDLSNGLTKNAVSKSGESTKRNSRALPRPSATSRRISCMGTGFAQAQPVAPLRDMRVPRQSMTFRGAMLNINRYRLRASSCPNIFRNSIITIAQPENQNAWSYLDDFGEMLTACIDVNHCMDVAYLIFALSNFILYIFYDTVYMYLTDYALGVGISPDESANLISAIGVLNCIGMIFMGYIGDQIWCSPMLVYNVSMVVCGLSVIAMPFITDYWILACASAIFGLFISANYALTAVILVELISLEAFSKSYGLLLLIQGLANLIGPPIVGFMADATGGYVIPFVISGAFIVVCGLMLSLISPVQKCQERYSRTSTPSASPRRQTSINKNQNISPALV